uniref:Uncharacterized protein n=1 Tax=Ciona intestinalis TaxID=7719 RepID=H2XVR6_CIOIN
MMWTNLTCIYTPCALWWKVRTNPAFCIASFFLQAFNTKI